MNFAEALLISVVEGVTEFLPISSTGHIILTSTFLGIQDTQFVKDFTVIVQFGAIMSVFVLYWRRFIQSLDIYKKLFIGFLPAAVIGLAVKNDIDKILGSAQIVAWALIIGGVILIVIDKRVVSSTRKDTVTFKDAFVIGLVQCFAFIPGVSRAAATIVGGLWRGLDRQQAAEFSFLLALPTLSGATAIKLLKIVPTITRDEILIILLGNVVSFVVALFTIKGFIYYLTKFGFAKFGIYRIAIGLLTLFVVKN
ncbi:MAG: UDP-diphosphatase [Bdellovibrionales bacterium RBG_16_40_8]|nr:MAG: UDP-diphosphatase [Bdellovibrionales bacterium RBG_16_40_8]